MIKKTLNKISKSSKDKQQNKQTISKDKIINYDVVIIGGGGGANIAKYARENNLKVAIIEKERLGGTCLNRGCIPSKMLIHPAEVCDEIREAKKYNIKNNTKFEVDFKKLITRITENVFEDSDNLAKLYTKLKTIDYYNKEAKFVNNTTLQVGRKFITGKKIIIGVGARPNTPPIPGLQDTPYWTSTQALRNTTQPKSLLVIGGGYIGVELGYAYDALGTKTNFLVRGNFIPREDEEIIQEFDKEFRNKHKITDISSIEKVEYINGEFKVQIKDKQGKKKTVKAEKLLVATGVKSNNDLLGLENTNIKTNKFGYLQVNKHLETTEKNIYGIGDCVGNFMFRHSVNFETEYLIKQLFDKKTKKAPINYPPMPHAIFSSPQVAGIGPTEQELKQSKTKYFVGKCDYRNSAMGSALLSDYGFCKLIFEQKTQKLISAHIIGPQSSVLIHQLIAHIHHKAKLDDLLQLIYIHPALPEIVRNAARDAKKNINK
jgi:dihydrolipoamide dehydrogenase